MSAEAAVPIECEHRIVVTYAAEGDPSLWACSECSLRFYPACRTCVDVGHRNIVHPAAAVLRAVPA